MNNQSYEEQEELKMSNYKVSRLNDSELEMLIESEKQEILAHYSGYEIDNHTIFRQDWNRLVQPDWKTIKLGSTNRRIRCVETEDNKLIIKHIDGTIIITAKEVKKIEIEQYCDGWSIEVDDKKFSWDHNDEDMGVESIKNLLEYLGNIVTLEECY